MIVCTPAVAKLALYVAVPFASRVKVVGVDPLAPFGVPAPSVVSFSFPVGAPVPGVSATVIVILSSVLALGDEVAAATVVVVAIRVVALVGHAATRVARSTDPSPVTSSYPVPALNPPVVVPQ